MPAASVLVTGATGFIGIHLVARLLSEGRSVTVLARSSSVLPAEWRDRVRVVASDDFSESNLRGLLNRPVRYGFSSCRLWRESQTSRDIDEIVRINMGVAGCAGAAMRGMARAHGNGGQFGGVPAAVDQRSDS